jgi:hypothetical protein
MVVWNKERRPSMETKHTAMTELPCGRHGSNIWITLFVFIREDDDATPVVNCWRVADFLFLFLQDKLSRLCA